MLGFSKISLNFWTLNISARKDLLLVKIPKYAKYHQTYLEAQFQVEVLIFSTFTGTDIPVKEELVDSEDRRRQFFFCHSTSILWVNSLCFCN